MFSSIIPLREPLLAARLLREEILAMPTPPSRREAQRARFPRCDGPPSAPSDALSLAAQLGSTEGLAAVSRGALEGVAALTGERALRSGPGEAFHGQPAPPPAEIPALFDEILTTINAPRAHEAWSPVVRAFALHFVLRLVQPFAGSPAAVAHAAEALVLASDGFDARRMWTGPAADAGRGRERPDPDAFALERANALVQALGETRDTLRDETARALLGQWAEQHESGLNERQRAALRRLDAPGSRLEFRDYVTLNSARRGAGLRSLQRDWRALREEGWIVAVEDDAFALSTAPLEWGASPSE